MFITIAASVLYLTLAASEFFSRGRLEEMLHKNKVALAKKLKRTEYLTGFTFVNNTRDVGQIIEVESRSLRYFTILGDIRWISIASIKTMQEIKPSTTTA